MSLRWLFPRGKYSSLPRDVSDGIFDIPSEPWNLSGSPETDVAMNSKITWRSSISSHNNSFGSSCMQVQNALPIPLILHVSLYNVAWGHRKVQPVQNTNCWYWHCCQRETKICRVATPAATEQTELWDSLFWVSIQQGLYTPRAKGEGCLRQSYI